MKILILLALVALSVISVNDVFADHETSLKPTAPSGLIQTCGPNSPDCRNYPISKSESIVFELHASGVYSPIGRFEISIDNQLSQFRNDGSCENGSCSSITVTKIRENVHQITINAQNLTDGSHTIKIDSINWIDGVVGGGKRTLAATYQFTIGNSIPSNGFSQNDCITLARLRATELDYTVVTCDFPFNVIVNMGQRLSWSETLPWQGKYYHTITSKTGLFDMTDMGSTNMLPSAWGGIGVYEYYDKLNPTLTGKITVQNPPDVGITFQNVQVSFSGSQMSVSGNIVNSNNFPVKNLYVYWHVTDSSGKYLTSWTRYGGSDGQAYSSQIPAQSTGTFSETVCCVPSSGASTATPYIVQAFRDDGTKLISINNSPTIPITTPSDTTLPVVIVPQNITVNLNSTSVIPSPVTFSVTATDNVGVVTQSCTPSSGSAFPVGTTTVSCTATDKAGNVGKASFTVTINKFIPTIIDTDKDGIPDSTDKCPTQAETVNGYQDTDGCPDASPQIIPTNEITITAASGSGAPGCEKTVKGCYIPKVASVGLGGKVIFKNTDTAAHTFTSWTTTDKTLGEVFNSSLVMAGSSYEWTPTTAGEFPYYCMVHPWMTGIILVGEGTYIPIPKDTDNDGIFDSLDSCPTQKETVNGFKDIDGCPDVSPISPQEEETITEEMPVIEEPITDTDKDGIPDSTDKCPTQKETVNGFKDTDGCPDKEEKKALDDKKALEAKKLAEKKAAEKKAAEKKAAEKKAAEKKAAEKKAAEKKAAEKKAAEKKAAEKKAAEKAKANK